MQRLVACEEEGESNWACLRCGGDVNGVTREVHMQPDEVTVPEEEGEEEEDKEMESEAESVLSQHEQWK